MGIMLALLVFVVVLFGIHVYAGRKTKRVLAEVERMTAEVAASNRRYAAWAAAQDASPAGRVVPDAGTLPDLPADPPVLSIGWASEGTAPSAAFHWVAAPDMEPLARAASGMAPPLPDGPGYFREVYAHHADIGETETEEWSLDVATDTDQIAAENSVPESLVRFVAGATIEIGHAVMADTDGRVVPAYSVDATIIGLATTHADEGEEVAVQVSGAASAFRWVEAPETTVAAAPSALPVIPLDTITDLQLEVDHPSFELDVTRFGDEGPTYINGRRETFTVTCIMTEALHRVDGFSNVLLHGREMAVMDITLQQTSEQLAMRVTYRLRPAEMSAPVAVDWLQQITGGRPGVSRRVSTAQVVAESFARATAAGTETSQALDHLGRALGDWSEALRAGRSTPKAPKPEPEPRLRPAGGRRFDLEDE